MVHNAKEGLAFLRGVDNPAFGMLVDTYRVNIEELSWTNSFRREMSAG